MMIKVVCGWCGDSMGEAQGEPRDGLPLISHGMCADCFLLFDETLNVEEDS
jgi:hypothetical protein